MIFTARVTSGQEKIIAEILTKKARAVLPKMVPLDDFVSNMANSCLMVAAFTKNDALPALIAFIALLPIFTRNLIAKSDLKLAFTIALSFLFANLFLKYYYQLGSRYLNQDFSQIISQKPIFKYNLYTAHAFREQFRQIQIWGLGWWIIGLFYVIKIKSLIINRLLLFAIVLIVIQILGYFLVFYVSKEDQASQIATSISRILLQIYPSGLLIAYYLISKGDRQKTNG